ncbi:MAG: divergent polysaccharide deacetylase family protein [Dialister sp.]|nr:divergent polysaccharide deacetylase family protein [Dialister sp.]MDY2621465.1 divergent polysaccharide deacetylase family protein [Dialister sp.]
MAVRRKRAAKKSNGHPFLVLLFFISLVVGSAYMTDRMTNAPTADNADQVTAIRHIFNDKEMQGLVPKEDQGTPESVKEKIKDIINKTVVVEAKADDEDTPKAVEVTKADGKTEPSKEVFSISRVVSKITGKEEPKAETPTETVVASASSERTESADSRERTSAPAPSSVKKTEPAKAAPAKSGKSEARANGSSEKALPAKAASILPPKENAGGQVTGRLAIVIDDAGRDLDSQHIYEQMGIPLTLAVMPDQVHTRDAALSWRAHGLPVILHQPMESVSGIGMEPKVILTSMSDTAIRQMLRDSLSQLPEAIGINNHQGSKATIDARTMDIVMNELHHRGLFFFDSHTNSTTAADKAAKTYGVPYVRNDLFVDNSASVSDICAMIQEGADRAKKKGTYIIIGHCRPHTAEAFRQMVPKLKAQGIEFVYLSSLKT